MKHDTTLTAMWEAVCGVRYWSQCARDKTVPFDPMEVDVHERQARKPIHCDGNDDDFVVDYGFRQGDGRFQRPVLRGDTIQFKNIDGPRSLMTAWKKLVSTSVSQIGRAHV